MRATTLSIYPTLPSRGYYGEVDIRAERTARHGLLQQLEITVEDEVRAKRATRQATGSTNTDGVHAIVL